ncbi:MAG: class I SAM-dependent methyltransferase [Deltaproteobacteria bacterium]|nr:class I SAM-dependent methyltransferase [Deltaproteobacteria bacterium]
MRSPLSPRRAGHGFGALFRGGPLCETARPEMHPTPPPGGKVDSVVRILTGRFALLAAVLRLYGGSPIAERAHVLIRWLLCPMTKLLARLPAEGRLLEIGCGHGLFSNLASVSRPRLRVLGIDPAQGKIGFARQSIQGRSEVEFRCVRVEDLPDEDFDAVAILDVLYLIPKDEWRPLLARSLAKLRPGGKLVLKENSLHPAWKFHIARFQEVLAVRVLKITEGSSRFAFADEVEMVGILKEAGAREVIVTKIDRGHWYPHTLYGAFR